MPKTFLQALPQIPHQQGTALAPRLGLHPQAVNLEGFEVKKGWKRGSMWGFGHCEIYQPTFEWEECIPAKSSEGCIMFVLKNILEIMPATSDFAL